MASKSSAAKSKPGGPTVLKVPEGDNRERLVCESCGFILYENPMVVVGAVCAWRDRILLCRRSIEPRRGYWTIPAGYLELGETTAEGAAREAMEEAGAEIDTRAKAYMCEHPETTYQDATDFVLTADLELTATYARTNY